MDFFRAIIDFVIILLLLRLLIRQVEANFNQIFNIIFRITDPLLKPAKSLLKNNLRAVLLSVSILVIIRGFIFIAIKPMPVPSGIGISFLYLFQLLFQFYMVVWFISVLTGYGTHNYAISMVQRAFQPLSSMSSYFKIPKRHFSFFSFIFLLLLFSVLNHLLYYIIAYKTLSPSFSIFHSIAEGLKLIIMLFIFPGFFNLVIIAGVLVSWVTPDPYNPIVQTIYGISEPFLRPFRRFIPSLAGLDFSPLIALICFNFIGKYLLAFISSVVRVI